MVRVVSSISRFVLKTKTSFVHQLLSKIGGTGLISFLINTLFLSKEICESFLHLVLLLLNI